MSNERVPEFRRALLWPLALLAFLACGGSKGSQDDTAKRDILVALNETPGISAVKELAATSSGARSFSFTYQQAVDHHLTAGTTFPQRATLIFRSYTAPMVLAATGYDIPTNKAYETEPTKLLQGNQLLVEQRFFSTSTPSPVDWSKLDIWQAASDHHSIVQALRPLFPGKWLSTGASKGGMTSVYHRRFYPADVDATVAYVAPNSLGDPDSRYIAFVDSRGNDASRTALAAWQQAVITRRAEVLPILEADAASKGSTFNILGIDKTLEIAVEEVPFQLWQYGDARLAAQVPAPDAPARDLYNFMDAVFFSTVYSWDDFSNLWYSAYWYQAATQLGAPEEKCSHLAGLLYPGVDLPENFPPLGISKTYDPTVMADIQNWVSSAAERIIFVYGENDPWSAGAFQVPSAAMARDNHIYWVTAGNHGSSIGKLTAAQQQEVHGLLSNWMGVPLSSMSATARPMAVGGELEDTLILRRIPPARHEQLRTAAAIKSLGGW